MVDLAHGLMNLVHRVHKGDANQPRLALELGHDGRAEGLGRNACAVRNDKNRMGMHGARSY
ncbi:hypothetical protein SDC9_178364 [bioreactor metagenome]|uniref:Uncharacterized protein n=1 Tax=bioreactor metagenome TaxID=1076179 RepID=A0A645H4W9_9ZZZZ